ncbi:MAG: LysM domain-containing protein, partial [Aeromicrobium sp.]|uniref:LysM peptidoglycan-binding domain-containing protein n=1 Tax=Aeromicrobium sp. TaxID=1871063 RepID=UPI0039E3CC10
LAPAWLVAALTTGAVLAGGAAQANPQGLDGLPLPDRPATQAAPAPSPPQASPAPTDAATVTVRPGDCLWLIARDHAPAGADDAEVARLTAAWHQANRAVIGADPNAIHPGQTLTAPTAEELS